MTSPDRWPRVITTALIGGAAIFGGSRISQANTNGSEQNSQNSTQKTSAEKPQCIIPQTEKGPMGPNQVVLIRFKENAETDALGLILDEAQKNPAGEFCIYPLAVHGLTNAEADYNSSLGGEKLTLASGVKVNLLFENKKIAFSAVLTGRGRRADVNGKFEAQAEVVWTKPNGIMESGYVGLNAIKIIPEKPIGQGGGIGQQEKINVIDVVQESRIILTDNSLPGRNKQDVALYLETAKDTVNRSGLASLVKEIVVKDRNAPEFRPDGWGSYASGMNRGWATYLIDGDGRMVIILSDRNMLVSEINDTVNHELRHRLNPFENPDIFEMVKDPTEKTILRALFKDMQTEYVEDFIAGQFGSEESEQLVRGLALDLESQLGIAYSSNGDFGLALMKGVMQSKGSSVCVNTYFASTNCIGSVEAVGSNITSSQIDSSAQSCRQSVDYSGKPVDISSKLICTTNRAVIEPYAIKALQGGFNEYFAEAKDQSLQAYIGRLKNAVLQK